SSSIFSKITQPPFDYAMLNKLGYGPDEYSLKRIKELGLKDYLEEQVNPNDAVDDIFNQKIQKLSYPIDYE
ncbi:hypothetical protein, partial [Enterobacter kobei]|uniref:hypothetical protein n=1 Tax=Enterobacter kobei TaxID=208224 RepID=UPI001953B135